jgi:hypothetical protein
MAWLTQQLVRDAARSRFWAVDNRAHLPSFDFEEPDRDEYVPRWGTVALLRLGSVAREVGLTPMEVVIRDRAKLPLPDDLEEEQSERIVDALRDGDLQRAHDLLEGERGPYMVMSLTLMDAAGVRWRVGRFGGFDVSSDGTADPLLKVADSILSIS